MPMIAMTTSSSTSVNAIRLRMPDAAAGSSRNNESMLVHGTCIRRAQSG
jgi:hypothetical protein